jgi:hypothetical protein
MNHNTYELEVEQTVTVDEEFRGGSTVVISAFTPNQMFATVHPVGFPDDAWDVMTYRLTPMKEETNDHPNTD